MILLLEKLKSNLQEVRARGGQLIVFGDVDQQFAASADTTLLPVPAWVILLRRLFIPFPCSCWLIMWRY